MASLIRLCTRTLVAYSLVHATGDATAAAAQAPVPPSRKTVAALSATIDSIAESHRTQQSIPGLSIAITTISGKVLYTRGYGFADVASRQPVTSATIFHIYSISKVYASTLVHQLVQAGRLSLGAPVGQYLPDLPAWRNTVTVRQLLAHTSGIEDYTDVTGYQEAMNAGRADDDRFVALALQQPLRFPPGSHWRYTSTAYVLIQQLTERLTGEPFGQSLVTRVLAPGSLDATSADCAMGPPATGYTWAWRAGLTGDSLVVSKARNAHQHHLAAGGLCSTPVDVARFFALLLGGHLVDSASVADMVRLVPIAIAHSGSGLFAREDDEGLIFEHSGGGGNGNSEVMAFPRDSIILSAAANSGGAELEWLLRALRRRILDLPERVVVDLPVSRDEIAPLLGVYVGTESDGRIVVDERGGRLFAMNTRLLKQADGTFVPASSPHLRLTFRVENGVGTGVIVSKYGLVESHWRRRP